MQEQSKKKEEIIWEKDLGMGYSQAPTSVKNELKIRLFKILIVGGFCLLLYVISLITDFFAI